MCKAHLKLESQQKRLWRPVGFGRKLKMFIAVDIWGTYNTFPPLPTTCSLSLERKRNALCQSSVGCTWVIRCLLKMSLAVRHRAGKQLGFHRSQSLGQQERWVVNMTSVLRKRKCEAAAGFLMDNSVGSFNPEFKKDRWEPESEWEANGNWYKRNFFFHTGLGRLMAESSCFLNKINAGESICLVWNKILLQHSAGNGYWRWKRIGQEDG